MVRGYPVAVSRMRLKRFSGPAYRIPNMMVLRGYLAFALSVLLVLTGQGVAASRGVGEAVGQMVLCTGTGPVVVYMDQDGQPTQPPHYCPDYALSLLGAVQQAEPSLPAPPDRALPGPATVAHNLISLPQPQTPARAPPVG